MSLLGFDMTGSATINGLTEINANNVFSDVLYYDTSTTPVNVKTAIDGITIDVTALEADVLTLQGEMNAVEADVLTLQGEMNDVEADIVTLQGDVAGLIASTAVTAATVAGLVISQAAQDVTLATHTTQIGILQGETFSLDTRVDALEVKTTDQSWGSLTGTSFSTKVNVGGGSGVVLNTASASEFNSGLNTSSVEPLAVGSNLAIGATQTTGILNIGTGASKTGAINIGTGASAKTTTLGALLSTATTTINGGVVNITGTGTNNMNIINAGDMVIVNGGARGMYIGTNKTGSELIIGQNTATASTTRIDIGVGSNQTGALNFGTGASAKPITIGSAASTNIINGSTTIAGTANINTTSLSDTNIGNGAAAGNFTVNAAANSITGTTNTLTSTGETEINCVALDVNASGATTLDTLTFNLTNTELSGTAMTWTSNTTGSDLILTNPTTGAFSIEAGANQDLVFKSTGTGDTYFDSASDVYINPVSVFQVTAGTGTSITSTTGDLSLYATGVGANLNINGTEIYILGATDINQTGTAATRIGNATGTLALTGSTNTVLGTTNINTTGTSATSIGNSSGALALTGSTNTVLGTTNINTTGTSATSIGNTTGTLTLTGSTYTCNTSGNQTITSSAGDVALTGSDVSITTTGTSAGEFVVRSNTNVDIATTTGDIELFANTTMLIKSGGTNTLTVSSANKMVTTSSTTTMTNTNLALNGITTVTGVTNINNTGTANTNIGNATGTTTVTGQATFLGNTQFGDASADSIVPNGTLTKPFIIGTYASQSSYSTTSTTPITTYLGGTLESVKTFTNSATGNFRYIMASVTPFDANGAITLTAGTYMFWLALNFEDASVFNLTDLTMGLTTISTLTTASSEATIIASLPNLTCFFHKTDAGDAAATDSENRVLSSCFNLASSTTVYPFYSANHSVTMDTVTCNTVFVKIGSA